MKLDILHWNVRKNDANVAQAFHGTEEYDVLALQEVRIGSNGSPPCPTQGRYRLIWSGEKTEGKHSRAAIYVNKKHSQASWSMESGMDWAKVTFGTGEDATTIWSVYSPHPTEGGVWNSPLQTMVAQECCGKHIIVGDMNLHHPLWDAQGRTSRNAETLVQLAINWDLKLLTPFGEPTRIGNERERNGTLDLAWATAEIQATYLGPVDYAGSDHVAQWIKVDDAPAPQVSDEFLGYSWALMDRNRVKAEAKMLPAMGRLTSVYDLEMQTDKLMEALQRIARVSTPLRKPATGKAAPWWDLGVKKATKEARKAQREHMLLKTTATEERLGDALKQQRKAIERSKTKRWRSAVAESSQDQRKLWNLERWARIRSHTPVEPPKLPALRSHKDGPQDCITHEEKARALSKRFFPTPQADTSMVKDPTFPVSSFEGRVQVPMKVTTSDVKQAMSKAGASKAPGYDKLSNGFLKACGKPLLKILAQMTEASFRLQHFPCRFREAMVVVLRKPGKTVKEQTEAGAYRPISLLCTVGKIIDSVMAVRIAQAAEESRLLPDMQMGNRANRSTELAVRILSDAVHTAWSRNACASLLQLDLSGAFDTVHHIRLLDTMRAKGLPAWVVRWVRSYLEDRTAILVFDGEASARRVVPAGVPQGSPLSPILFILYISTLYDDLERLRGNLTIGFADDTNLLAFGRDTPSCCASIERAWKICKAWADSRGMSFNPAKSELIHFTKTRKPREEIVTLDEVDLHPKEAARFLGVWIDRKLRFKEHKQQILKKMSTQTFALTRLAAKTWGVNFSRAREIYTKVIRSAMAYGAAVWHTPTPSGGKPKGVVKKLQTTQNKCLRVISGAYKATETRLLESEVWCPPLDLYLNRWVARFEERLEKTGMDQLIRRSCAYVARRVRQRRGRRTVKELPLTAGPKKAEWAKEWRGEAEDAETGERRLGDVDKALLKEWEKRWKLGQNASQEKRRSRPRRTEAAETIDFAEHSPWELHEGLPKAKSSLLTQARTGAIGLREFLFKQHVPDIPTPLCSCGNGKETVLHLVVECEHTREKSSELTVHVGNELDLHRVLSDKTEANRLLGWILGLGRLREYRLAIELAQELKDTTGANTERRATRSESALAGEGRQWRPQRPDRRFRF
jgi:hypothetical protein